MTRSREQSDTSEERTPETAREKAEQQAKRRQGMVYQAAFEAVTAILIAAGIGHLIDLQLDTSPRGAFIGLVIGFCSFVLRLVRLGRRIYGDGTDGDGTPDGDGTDGDGTPDGGPETEREPRR